MRIYITEYYIEEIDTKKRRWSTGFNAYLTKKLAEKKVKKDFKQDFGSSAKDYKLLDYIINEIQLHNHETA